MNEAFFLEKLKGALDEMKEIAALDQNKRYYHSTPDLLKAYVTMVPPVDEQK